MFSFCLNFLSLKATIILLTEAELAKNVRRSAILLYIQGKRTKLDSTRASLGTQIVVAA